MEPLVVALIALTLVLTIALLVFTHKNIAGLHRYSIMRKRTARTALAMAKKQADEARAAHLRELFARSPVAIDLSTSVQINDHWCDVYARVHYVANDQEWFEYRLNNQANGVHAWLTFEQVDDTWRTTLWEEAPLDVEFRLPPDKKPLMLDNETYVCTDSYSANFIIEGTLFYGKNEGAVEYFYYKSADHRLVSYARFDDGYWEVATGRIVYPHEV